MCLSVRNWILLRWPCSWVCLISECLFFVLVLLPRTSQRGPEVCLLFCDIMFSTHFKSWIDRMVCKHFAFFSLYPSISHLRYRPAKLALANYLGKQLSTIAALVVFGKQIDQRVEGWLFFSCHGEEFPTPVWLCDSFKTEAQWLANSLHEPAVNSSPQRYSVVPCSEIVIIKKKKIDLRPRYSNFITWVMGVRCNLGDVEGLETYWNERWGLGVAELNRALLLVKAAVQVQGMSNGTPSPTGLCSADWVHVPVLSIHTTCQTPASDTFKKYPKYLLLLNLSRAFPT